MQHLISICGNCFFDGIAYVQKHSSWNDNRRVYCHLLKRNLASFSIQQLIHGLTRGCRYPVFFPVDDFKLSTLNVSQTKSTRSTVQKVDITYRYINIVRILLTEQCLPLELQASEQWRLHPKWQHTPAVEPFTGGTNASKPVSGLTTKTMSHIRHSPTPTPPPPQKKKKLKIKTSYPHTID